VKLNKLLKAILEDSSGATAVEYGLIVALIVIAMISALNTFANQTISMWTRVSNVMTSVNSSAA
jgi:pilus assembly protein Flp/PilA